MSVAIIQAAVQDLDQIVPLFDAYRQFYRKPADIVGARAFIAERLNNKDSIILLALDATGKPVGFTQLYPSFSSVRLRRIWILNDLFVAPEARGQGVGRALMDVARSQAAAAGVLALALATEKDNHIAKALYEALGYARDDAFDYYELTL